VDESLQRHANLMKAMGHPSRLQMARALLAGDTCVCRLQELVGSDISTVSRHLAIMRSAGLVDSRKQGLWVYYRLRPEGLRELLACVQGLSAPLPSQSAPPCQEAAPQCQQGAPPCQEAAGPQVGGQA
jgi:ArsR family transcriptional regulator